MIKFQSDLKQHQQQKTGHSFFLFINDGSGGSLGTSLLEQNIEKIEFLIPTGEDDSKGRKCNAYFYNMKKNRDQGFKRLKQQTLKQGIQSFLIVCGGDGTVMWAVSELVHHEIRVVDVPIGIIPLGTGNDFSRELGWGAVASDLTEGCFKRLKKWMRKWLQAKIEYFDIWDVQAETFENGKLEKVQNLENTQLKQKIINKTFCNYFSFGIDGKIGYSFDMHRTKTRLGNLAMYACIGLCKSMTKTKALQQLLDTIEINKTSLVKRTQSLKQQKQESLSSVLSKQNSTMLIKSQSFRFDKKQQKQSNQLLFAKDFYNILALNINSYTGGVKDIWENAGNGFIKDYNHNDYEEPSTGDGKIEIVSFGSSVGIAMERTFGGFSKKVAQGEGPFIFNFIRYQNAPKHRTYLQIDGEFLRITHPKRIVLSHSSFVPNGKIRVIRSKAPSN